MKGKKAVFILSVLLCMTLMTACFPAMWPIFDDIREYADHFFSQTDSGETVDIVVDEKGD